MPAKIKHIKKNLPLANVFVQLTHDSEMLHLGTTVEPITFVETGTLRPSVRSGPWRRHPLGIEIKLDTSKICKGMERFLQNMEEMARARRRRLWPRWAVLFTLLMTGVAIWT